MIGEPHETRPATREEVDAARSKMDRDGYVETPAGRFYLTCGKRVHA